MPIAEGLGALKTAFDIGHAINQRVKEGKLYPNEIADQLLQLQQLILESQRSLNDAAEEIRTLKDRLSASDRTREIEQDLEYAQDGGFFVRKSERAVGKFINYCPVCWGENQKLVPLNPMTGEGFFKCTVHNSLYETAAYRRRNTGFISPPMFEGPDEWK